MAGARAAISASVSSRDSTCPRSSTSMVVPSQDFPTDSTAAGVMAHTLQPFYYLAHPILMVQAPWESAMRQLILLCLALLPLVAQADAAPAPASDADKLVGLWGSERVFGPAAAGTLTLDGRREDWQAEVAGFKAPVRHTTGEISFILPGGAGSFEGREDPGGKAIT